MPEIKNTFTQGKMNKDLDERLLPNGQYKDAMNVQVSTSEGSAVGTVQNVLGNQSLGGLSGECVGSITDEKNNKLYWFITTSVKDAIYEYDEGTSPIPIFIDTKVSTNGAVLEFGDRIITGINVVDDFLFWTDGTTEPKKINITRSKTGTVDAFTHTKLVVGGSVAQEDDGSGTMVDVDIKKEHITVIKKKPTSKVTVNLVTSAQTTLNGGKPSLFEKTLSRFSYRYKYEDGEYSAFGPFTDVIFNPLYPDGKDSTNYFLPKDPYNLAMLNKVDAIELYDFIGPDTPEDVVQVDILYKQENSTVVYSIASVKRDSTGWDAEGYSQGNSFQQNSSYKGYYSIQYENIYAAVPENQLLRVYDNVPRSALSQEVTGSRLVYGNYVQNYNIDEEPEVYLDYVQRLNFIPGTDQGVYNFTDQGLRSIKSQRNYQLGVVFGDEFGRETPVFSSTNSAIKVPWASGGNLSASQSYQLMAYISSNIPSWVDYYKFYVKQTSGEYYNLVMDKAYTPIEYVEGADKFDHIWIAFPSSDRNKINVDDYLILKKKLDGTNIQFAEENRFKILDIQNEAPDAIKFQYKVLGVHTNSEFGNYTGLLDDNPTDSDLFDVNTPDPAGIYQFYPQRMDVEGNDIIQVDKSNFENLASGTGASLMPGVIHQEGVSTASDLKTNASDTANRYISWNNGTEYSKRYRISNIRLDPNGTDAHYMLKLEESISAIDADIAKHPTDTNATHPRLHEDLTVTIERKDLKDVDQFSGRFFAKIIRDGDSNSLQDQPGSTVLSVFNVLQQVNTHWFADSRDNMHADDQAVNNFDLATAPSSTHTVTTVTGGTAGDLTTTRTGWSALHAHADTNNAKFFIDNMYFVGGQNSSSFTARNSGSVVRGVPITYGQQTWSNLVDNTRKAPPRQSLGGNFGTQVTPTVWNGAAESNINFWPRVLSGQPEGPASQDHIVYVWTDIRGTNIEDNYDDELGDMENGATGYAPYYLYANSVQGGTSRWKPFSPDSNNGWFQSNATYPPNNTGWLAQSVTPDMSGYLNIGPNSAEANANVMEGLIVTDDTHTGTPTATGQTAGSRKWRIEGELQDTNYQDSVYGTTNGKVFLHLSFLGPGQDLVPDNIDLSNATVAGYYSLANHLQGIWGGGTFVADGDYGGSLEDGVHGPPKRGGETVDWARETLIECEGNYVLHAFGGSAGNRPDSEWYTEPTPPGPGVGQGYDQNYADLHNNQWNINFPNTIQNQKYSDFANALSPGAVIKFVNDPDNTLYTINSVRVKKIYNHTLWKRTPVQGIIANMKPGTSVEEAAIDWAQKFGSAALHVERGILEQKIKDFGAKDNRRLVYILELDQNPTNANVSPNFNPVDGNNGLTASTFGGIQIVTQDSRNLLGKVISIPAVFETEPKEETGLDIYYEASGAIPAEINMTNRELFAPVGCRVEIVEADGTLFSFARNGYQNVADDIMLEKWDDTDELKVKIIGRTTDGFNKFSAFNVAISNYGDKYMRFYRVDGSYTTAKIDVAEVSSTDYLTEFTLESSTIDKHFGLSWYNCFSFGDGVESDRIRDDFNAMKISSGARASTTTEEPYEEDHRKYGLIFSGLYNSNSSLNELNQFIMAEKITKDINPTYGSIQKLFSRNTDLVTFCEDRVIKILANKDAVFNADGNPQLTANINVLGQTIPFIGDYGISKNPESFAKESYRAYFADKQRGAVLRLSKDGLTPISDHGMHDWFRDNLKYAGFIVGSYDAYKRNYNITLKEAITLNLLTNSTISKGTLLDYTVLDTTNYVDSITGTGFDEVTGWFDGSNGYLTGDSAWWATQPQHVSTYMNRSLLASAIIREYPQISAGYFQQFSAAGTIIQASSNEVFDTTTASTDITYMAAYGGGSNGFNNITGAPSHNQDRFINDSMSNLPNNGTDYTLASGVDNNIWHFGQGVNSVTTSPSGGGINNTEWSIINKGIAFQSYPDLSAPVSLNPDTSFIRTPIAYGFPSSARNNFFAGTEILNSTAQSGIGLFETVPSGGLTIPMTIFNGEEVEIKIKFHIPPYQNTAQGAEDTVNGPTVSGLLTSGDTAPDTNKPGSGVYKGFEIKLHEGTPASDGSTVIASSLLMNPPNNTNQNLPYTYSANGFNSNYQTSPIFQTSSYAPTLDTSPEKEHTFTLKFTNGTENAGIVVERLQITVHLIFTDSAGNKYTDPSLQTGSAVLDYLYIIKRYRLEDVGTPAITQQADIPAIPATTIPAWTEVVIPDYPDSWSSQSPQYGGSSPVPPRDYFEMLNNEAQFGTSNPPITQSQDGTAVNMSDGSVFSTGTTYNWYEGTNNSTTGYQDTYTTPNEIYDLATDTFITQTVDDGTGVQVSFPEQPGIYETVRIKAQTMNSDWTQFRLDIVNSNTNDKLEIGAWYCIDVFADESGVGLAPETNGTWSPTGQGQILVYDVCNTNLVLDSNDELNWGTGGSTTERYPVGHLGKIIKGDTIAQQSWYGGNAGDNIPRRHIALEYYKPNMRDSSVSGSVWTLAGGTERSNIGETTYGTYWNVGNPSYRAIFQNHPNSHAAKASNQSGQNYFNLVFRHCDIDVRTIAITKIQSPTNTNPAVDGYGGMLDATPNLVPTISSSAPWITHEWWRSAADGGSNFSGFNHGLKDPKCYYLENQGYGGLNFDSYAYHTSYDGSNVQNKPGASAAWMYYFNDHPSANPAGSLNSPQESTEGWELAFEVNKGVDKFGIPRANMEGSFNGRVTNKVGDFPVPNPQTDPPRFGGFEFGNLQHDGHYKITGNMNGNGPYEILYKGPHSSTPTQYVNYNTVVSNAQIVNIGDINTWMPLDNSAYAARVYFNSQGQAPFAFVGAIKDVTLKNNTDWFTGGSIDAWSFQGFDPVDDDFIFFDDQTNPQNPAIGFNNAPSTTVVADRIQVQQVISNVTYINESYLIEFEYDITGGEIECYYFNNAGDGFRTSSVTGSGFYSSTHIVGELDVNTGLPLYTKHNDELVNTFVIFASSGFVSGTIDTLSMKQITALSPRHVYSTPDDNPTALAPSTVTYDESVKGWVSFKSYIPEQGLSLAKKYYTIKNGTLYEHHALGVSRNLFYSNFIESSLTAVLNQEPSTIKMFNTLNYEGTQSKVDQYITSGDLSNIDTYNLQAKSGWYANYIHTDKQRGNIKEFIEKEGKWFNYIKGVTSQDMLDTAEFSFQGLGIVSSVDTTNNQSL